MINMKNPPVHKVYIVGAGPGDPELLTIKAKRLLTEYADVVVHDRLISNDILKLIPKKVEKIFAGKEPELHHMKQEDINSVLVKKTLAGKKVVRLKGGDPFIFGRGGEEAEYLRKHKIEFEIVPGITSAIGAAAEAFIPLTYRGVSDGVIFITGHNYEDDEPKLDYKFLAKTDSTIVIYMGVKNISVIAKKLIKCGMNPKKPCLAISEATNKSSRKIFSSIGSISGEMSKKDIKNPCLIYIGDVVKISQKLSSK